MNRTPIGITVLGLFALMTGSVAYGVAVLVLPTIVCLYLSRAEIRDAFIGAPEA